MKYLFIVGAPGSKWSGVARSIYFSPSIDRTDHREENVYDHHQSGVSHLGAYFDPGMEYGTFFDVIEEHSREDCEAEFNAPFESAGGTRIIKSHVLCEHLPFLRKNWPDSPIVTVLRGDEACLEWWLGAGGFDIKYPSYRWYENNAVMLDRIRSQNAGIRSWLTEHPSVRCTTNVELAETLGLGPPPDAYFKNFAAEDTEVFVTIKAT